jgi:hypothetical protein
MFPGKCQGVSFFVIGNGMVWIFLSIEHEDQRKEILMVSRIQIGHISAI